MTKKDFELIASVIRAANTAIYREGTTPYDAIAFVTLDMANRLVDTNPRFDRDRFLAACKGGGN